VLAPPWTRMSEAAMAAKGRLPLRVVHLLHVRKRDHVGVANVRGEDVDLTRSEPPEANTIVMSTWAPAPRSVKAQRPLLRPARSGPPRSNSRCARVPLIIMSVARMMPSIMADGSRSCCRTTALSRSRPQVGSRSG
jgi:hypothetical protein